MLDTGMTVSRTAICGFLDLNRQRLLSARANGTLPHVKLSLWAEASVALRAVPAELRDRFGELFREEMDAYCSKLTVQPPPTPNVPNPAPALPPPSPPRAAGSSRASGPKAVGLIALILGGGALALGFLASPDPAGGGVNRDVALRLSRVSDPTLKAVLATSGTFGQAAVCGVSQDRIITILTAHRATAQVLGGADGLKLSDEIVGEGARAQRDGRGAPCPEVNRALDGIASSYRSRGLMR